MLVVSCGAKRSGSTLSYLLTSKLIEQAGLGSPEGYFETLSINSISSIMGIEKSDWITLIKTHDVEGTLELKRDNVRFIYTLRDPKEMVISGLKKFSWTETEAKKFLENFAIEAAMVTRDERALTLDYTNITSDLKSQVEIIANFIDVTLTPEQVSLVCGAAMKPKALGRFSQEVVRAKRSMLHLARRLHVSNLARLIGLSPKFKKSVVYFLNSIDPKTLIHADHNTSEIPTTKNIEVIVEALGIEICAAQRVYKRAVSS